MWEVKSEILDQHVQKFSLFKDTIELSYEQVIQYWRENPDFRSFYFSILESSTFDAFFWEHPPVTKGNLNQKYEFVLVDSLQLSKIKADPSPFQKKFSVEPLNGDVIAFENLGRDAQLIVPRALVSPQIYAHLACFIHNAPEDQKHDLFISLGDALHYRINEEPTWVSTSGLGVSWLHIRLDARPKYYSHAAYRQ